MYWFHFWDGMSKCGIIQRDGVPLMMMQQHPSNRKWVSGERMAFCRFGKWLFWQFGQMLRRYSSLFDIWSFLWSMEPRAGHWTTWRLFLGNFILLIPSFHSKQKMNKTLIKFVPYNIHCGFYFYQLFIVYYLLFFFFFSSSSLKWKWPHFPPTLRGFLYSLY